MKCPIDDTQLVMTDRQGVEIDYCPQCRGVWLDRGELDKIIEKSESSSSAPQPQQREQYPQQQPGYDDKYHKKKKRESFLGDLFDF